jgi:predicted nucleotidyltransferase
MISEDPGMFDVEKYIQNLIDLLKQKFGTRLLYVGLQGSYLRGEATENSDVDIIVILDELNVEDLKCYRSVILGMENADKSCGFICGRQDLANWNPMEIYPLLCGTKDYYGTLSQFVPAYSREDVRNFAKMSLNNMYHELCHRYIHGKTENTENALPFLYKSAFFILQNLHFLQIGNYIATKKDLLACLNGSDKEVLSRAMAYSEGKTFDFQESYRLIFQWCQMSLRNV